MQLATYNHWANQQILQVAQQLTPEQAHSEIVSSFNSVHKTIHHMMNAEYIWWNRMRLTEVPFLPYEADVEMSQMVRNWLAYSLQWKEWTDKASLNALEHEFMYQNTKREQFKQPVYQVMLHLFNHQTYHRGQLVTMFRQLGITNLPATDFIAWCRMKKH